MDKYEKPDAKLQDSKVKLLDVQVAWHCNPERAVRQMQPKIKELVIHLGHDPGDEKL